MQTKSASKVYKAIIDRAKTFTKPELMFGKSHIFVCKKKTAFWDPSPAGNRAKGNDWSNL